MKEQKVARWLLLSLIVAVTTTMMMACACEEYEVVANSAKDFAQHYFNFRLKQAATLCTQESKKWIEFRATNITQEDLDVLNSQTDTAVCDIEESEVNGSEATALVSVSNFLLCDSIDKSGHMCVQRNFKLSLRKTGDRWLVVLHKPL